MIQIFEQKRDGALVVSLKGRLDGASAASALDQLLACADRSGHGLVLDCSDVGYVSSAGLRVVLMVSKRVAERGGKLVVCCLSQPARLIFDLAGVTSILGNYDSVEAAMEVLRP